MILYNKYTTVWFLLIGSALAFTSLLARESTSGQVLAAGQSLSSSQYKMPAYPANPEAAGKECEVVVRAFVNGTEVDSAIVTFTSLPYVGFEDAAVGAVKQWHLNAPRQTEGNVRWCYRFLFSPPDVVTATQLPGPDDFVPFDIPAEPVRRIPPQYSYVAKAAGLEGTVWVKALVDQTGKVIDTLVHKSSGSPLLNSAALQAAGKWEFKPAEIDGQPIATWVVFSLGFEME